MTPFPPNQLVTALAQRLLPKKDAREQTAAGDSSLEDLFLRLTGGLREGQLDTALDG